MPIAVVRPQDLTAAQVAAWSALQARAAAWDSPFLSPHWARAVERAQADDARGVRVAVVQDGAGRDLGFMAARSGAVTAMPAGAPMCDYQAPVLAEGAAFDPKDFVRALGVQRFDFSHMLADDPAFGAYAQGRELSHVVDVGQGFAAYDADRRVANGLLKDADKKRRKVGRELAEPAFTALSAATGDLEQLIAWKRAQLAATAQTDIFETPWTTRLLRQLLESRDPDFGGALFTLHFGDRLAAAHFHLRGRATIHAWIIAHDLQFERYSPGILLFHDILRWMDGGPYARLDLGPGEVRFKRELANAGQWVSHGFVGRISTASLVRQAAYGVCRAAEALPLGRVSELPAKALRRMDQWRGLR